MQIKIKICKCGNQYEQYNTLQNMCVDCLIKKGKKKLEKEFRKETRRRKKELKTRTEWRADTQKTFNKYIRIRDKNDDCISCGRTNEEVQETDGWKPGGAWDCGHFKSVGSSEELRFHPFNSNKQCKSCNGGSGKYTKKNHTVSKEYRERLIDKIGIENVEWLEGSHQAQKLTIEDFQEINAYYKEQIKILENQ